MEELCRAYWKPIFSFIRMSGVSEPDAEDLTQSFFAKLLKDDAISRAEQEKGRLRSFLLGAVKRHLVDFHRHFQAQKRGGGVEHLPLAQFEGDSVDSEHEFAAQPVDERMPDRDFDQQWAMTILARAHERVREAYVAGGKGAEYELLKGVVATSGEVDYAHAARTMRIQAGHVRVLAHRLRKNFRAAAKDEIAETVGSLGEVEDELRYLLEVFS